MKRIKPSVNSILTDLGLSGPEIRKLTDKTRDFMMLHNQHDIERVSRLGSTALENLARNFLTIYGGQFFPTSGPTSMKWPEDMDGLVDQITRIMFRQKMHKYYRWKAMSTANQDTVDGLSESDSEDESSSTSSRKRLETEGTESWHPANNEHSRIEARIYPTRSNAQLGMPILQSIETGSEHSRSERPVNKRPRLGSSSQTRIPIAVDSPSLAETTSSGAADISSQPIRRPLFTVDIPYRAPTRVQGGGRVAEAGMPKDPDLLCSEPSEQSTNSKGNEDRGYPRPWPLTGRPFIDDFIIENHLHLSSTPDERDSPPPDAVAQLCEPTPPASSVPPFEDTGISLTPKAPSEHRHAVIRCESEEVDSKTRVRLTSLTQDYPNMVDLTGHDMVEIQVGDAEFKTIERTRGPRILQKLIDVLMDEIRICRRNARQAPFGQSKRIWEVKTSYIEELFSTILSKEELWQGGCFADRSVAML